MKTAWVLNLDAELELADPAGHRRSPRLRAHSSRRAGELLDAVRRALGIAAVAADAAAGDGWLGFCWCPTPSALDELAANDIPAAAAPPAAVLAAVNHRRFAADLGQHLPGAAFVDTMAALDAVLATPRQHGWLLKRPFGFSGRWRKRVAGPPAGADRVWCEASMIQYGGGLQVEPWVECERAFAVHGWVDGAGLLRGEPVVQRCSVDGAWLGQRPARPAELAAHEHELLVESAAAVAHALDAAGYFGPFSVDGFRWRDGGEMRFQPLSDVNARFTMGFFDAMAPRARELVERLAAAGR